jgi:hypothetical protein
MTREEANRMIQGFFRAQGVESPGLNDNNLGAAAVGDSQIYFEYQPHEPSLKCSALIYKFQTEPRPGVIEGFQAEEADTGGGTVDYEPENKGLYLSRSYTDTVTDAQFTADLDHLMKASKVYGGEVLERVASKVFAPEQ